MIGRLKWREGLALGCAMNARGSTEVIVASIGLSMGALTQNLYTMIVTMAVITTMAMPPMLRAALNGIPMTKDEEVRIQRETLDQKGFLPGLERLLLAVDESAVGRMAARLAGLLAGAQGMPVTILKLDAGLKTAERNPDVRPGKNPARDDEADAPVHSGHGEQADAKDTRPKDLSGAQSRPQNAAELKSDLVVKEVKAGAQKSAAIVMADQAEPDPEKVHLTARVPVDAPADVVRDEARKGYDVMFIGLDDGVETDGSFAPKISQLAAGFEGPLMIFANAADSESGAKLTSRSRLLVPVNGSPQSRRAAETAFALARATGAGVHALFVSQTDGGSRTRVREEKVLKDIARLGERYDVAVSTHISSRTAAPAAILKEARRGYAMIVMGVSARPGEDLFFGNTVMAVLKEWKNPVLMVGLDDCVLTAFQPMDAEQAVLVAPHRAGRESGPGGNLAEAFDTVFVAVLGMDGFARGEFHHAVGQPDALAFQADQIHFDALGYRVVRRVMGETVQVKTGAQFAIGARQQIFVERRCHTRGVVIRGMQQGRVLYQIDADQKAAAIQHLAHPPQQRHRGVGREIADGAAGEETGAPRRARHRRHLQRQGEIANHAGAAPGRDNPPPGVARHRADRRRKYQSGYSRAGLARHPAGCGLCAGRRRRIPQFPRHGRSGRRFRGRDGGAAPPRCVSGNIPAGRRWRRTAPSLPHHRKFAGQFLGRAAQALGNITRETVLRQAMGGGDLHGARIHQRSSASRMPLNCQRAAGWKKLR